MKRTLLLTAMLLAPLVGLHAAEKTKPNLLHIHADDHRPDGLRALGNPLLAGSELIPRSVIEKPPSAELRPDQKDSDSLPSYDILDRVITAYAEEDKSVEQIAGMGIDREIVQRAAKLIDSSEYKRRQSPPGVKITARAFGRDKRLPITNRFNGPKKAQ